MDSGVAYLSGVFHFRFSQECRSTSMWAFWASTNVRFSSSPVFVLYATPTPNSFCHRRTNLVNPRLASTTSPPRRVDTWLETRLTGGGRSVPMRDDRLRVTHLFRVLTQRWQQGASRFSTLRSVRRLVLLFTGRYVSRGEVRFCTPPGCKCDLLLVLGLKSKLSSGSIYGGISALARGYSHGVTFFQNLAGLQRNFTFFVSPRYRLTVELVRRGPL